MNLAIILARSGSKRIKKKNIRRFLNKPIIHYSIDAIKKTKILTKYIYLQTLKKLQQCHLSMEQKFHLSDLKNYHKTNQNQ